MSNNQEIVGLVLRFSLSAALTYLSWRMIRELIEPNRKERLAAEKRVNLKHFKAKRFPMINNLVVIVLFVAV